MKGRLKSIRIGYLALLACSFISGRAHGCICDGNHNLTATIDALGYSNQFFYDSQNNLYRSLDKRGNPSTFGYNAQFSLTGATNGAGK